MERRRLGADGPEISVLGIGTAPIGSGSNWIDWGAQDEGEAIAAIHAALDAGANWIDTAPFYGWGRAEEIVRRALAGRRDEVFLFTKCGTMPAPDALSRMDNRPEAIRAELVAAAHALAPVTTCQEQLSLLAGPDDPRVLEVVREHGIGLLCWAPLASGFLTDDFSVEALEPDDFRRRSRLAGRGPEVEQHRGDARARGRTLRRHAIAWVLEQPGVTAAIVGVRNAREGAELAALTGE